MLKTLLNYCKLQAAVVAVDAHPLDHTCSLLLLLLLLLIHTCSLLQPVLQHTYILLLLLIHCTTHAVCCSPHCSTPADCCCCSSTAPHLHPTVAAHPHAACCGVLQPALQHTCSLLHVLHVRSLQRPVPSTVQRAPELLISPERLHRRSRPYGAVAYT
ncbi:MAG: hypothetical protein ACT6T3_22430, partial [Agrobacterium sp.]|uniref:hypothetical protein n=1 Tax=Agrobacterium sp. TaxID=361 RepID=UPI004034E9B0